MRNLALRGVAVFFVLLTITTIMMDVTDIKFGTVNYWNRHGVFLLIFLAIFPRLTLLISSIATGGLIWWLGFFFFPRILIATLATVNYFQTNPVLVSISWLIALGGEVFEKSVIGKGKFKVHTFKSGPRATYSHPEEQKPPTSLGSDDVIEAEFTKK